MTLGVYDDARLLGQSSVRCVVGRLVIGVFIILASAANWAQAQSCDLFIAALRDLGADSANTILVDHTVMSVPTFAFNAFSSLVRGDTALASAAAKPLRELNATRVPVTACLTTAHAAASSRWEVFAVAVHARRDTRAGSRWSAISRLERRKVTLLSKSVR